MHYCEAYLIYLIITVFFRRDKNLYYCCQKIKMMKMKNDEDDKDYENKMN